MPRMDWWQALVLGIVEGLTEFVPVSSTGHIMLAERLLGIPSNDATDAFAVFIQVGAILAVLVLYRGRVVQALNGLAGHDPIGRKLLINLIVAFAPAVVIGLAFNKMIERVLFGLWPTAIAWFVGGVAILAMSRWYARNKERATVTLETLSVKAAFIIGLAQVVAMWPGTSRSLMTLLTSLAMGLSISAALEFSFLLGLLTLSAASGYKLLKYGKLMLASFGPAPLVIGVVVSLVVATFMVRWMVAYLRDHDLKAFGYWRIALALVVVGLLSSNVITP